ncbi:hypothetical protein Bbelb_155220 [Branchiostoma belcheri]|nr:hypothetical protein Bbelb_155220 [Branchiostoma belcheri]
MAYLLKVRCKSIYQKMGFHLLNPSALSHFEPMEDRVSVDNPAEFFQHHGQDYYVCCADFNTKEVVLVKPSDVSTVRKAAFFNEALRKHAEELLVIPFSQLADVGAKVANDVAHVTTIFLYISMRCGSTLLIKALEASGKMHTLSESDLYANFSRYVLRNKEMPEVEMEMLLDVIKHTNTLFNYTLLQEDPSKTTICYKMRGQILPVADLLQRALPKVKNIFLYRDLLGTVDSYAHVMAGGRYWKYWLQTSLKYEELCKYKEEMVIKVLDCLGMKCVDEVAKVKIRKVFGVNSQAGHSLSSRGAGRGECWVGEWEMGIISKILDHCSMGICTPNFVLDGTLTQI